MGMAGADRALLYGVMLATGLQKSEAGSLRPASFSLETDLPAVTIDASYSKRRRKDTLPLPASLAARLRRWLADKPEGQPVFNLTDKPRKMFYRDLARAQIARENRDGVVDLHSFRHSFVTAIVSGGANIKAAQELDRHSTPKLTFDVYPHARLHDVVGAVERLPDPFQAPPQTASARATGTDGQLIRETLCRTRGTEAVGYSRILT